MFELVHSIPNLDLYKNLSVQRAIDVLNDRLWRYLSARLVF